MKRASRILIKELRLVVTDACPYSCRYCNVYYKKLSDARKISRKSLLARYKIGNESYGLLAPKPGNLEPFSSADYKFLFNFLADHCGLEDITFTGGDPFVVPDIVKIINIADRRGLRTTAITKGAPLFSVKTLADARKKLGRLSRIIFSIDTLDSSKHAKQNLPLVPFAQANLFLPKTLLAAKRLASWGFNIEVNSVLPPINKKSPRKSFVCSRGIIDFCFFNKMKKLKFIELDSEKTLGRPYMEKYFADFAAAGFLSGYSRAGRLAENISRTNFFRVCYASRSESEGGRFDVLSYRTHCPSTFLRGGKNKRCEFAQGGELHLDFFGRSFLCQRDKFFREVSIYDEVKSRDVDGLSRKIIEINREIKRQVCSF